MRDRTEEVRECATCKEEKEQTDQRVRQEYFCTICRRQGHSNKYHITAYMSDITKEINNLNKTLKQKVTDKYISRELARVRRERDQLWKVIGEESTKLAKVQGKIRRRGGITSVQKSRHMTK